MNYQKRLFQFRKDKLATSLYPDRYSLSHHDVIEAVKQFFLTELVGDPQDGSNFDLDILRNLEALQEQYKED